MALVEKVPIEIALLIDRFRHALFLSHQSVSQITCVVFLNNRSMTMCAPITYTSHHEIFLIVVGKCVGILMKTTIGATCSSCTGRFF